ncbi:MAG TPA: cytochrome c oxidase assembly protein [Thermoleophilaceae bacterium]|nr:cytochrome c oxidase assembly protein [Thermoleophilaceae bacterium]
MELSLAPGPILYLLLAEVLYLRAVRVLGRRGYEVPFWQQVAWHFAVACMAIGLMGPLDPLADELLVAHMAQHLLIADIAAPLLLVGLRSPVHAFLIPRPVLVPLARCTPLRTAFRVLRRPLVAIPVWILTLYGWHFGFMFEAALANDLVHALQHQSFVAASLLVWWSVIEPKRRRLPGELWKVPYLLGARLAGMFLGMAFIIMRAPAYEQYARTAAEHGWSPLTDQQVAGGMMLGLDLAVMLFATGFFFLRSGQDHDRAEQRRRAAVLR